ncbi:MAG: hypothetical protein K6C41_07790 [Lachnospiraceae bacterium]|nr:hypothetical protein [Lachnospiraceae bacterium]
MMRYHDIHCRLTDKEYERLKGMVNGGAISRFIRRQIFLGTDWSRILEIKAEIQKIRTELVRADRVGSLENTLKENNEKIDELDRKLDQLIYLQKAAQAMSLQGSEDPKSENTEENHGNNKDH